jgi:hypothetical protein
MVPKQRALQDYAQSVLPATPMEGAILVGQMIVTKPAESAGLTGLTTIWNKKMRKAAR